jgi:TolB-like protein/Flp pilus assembly protein TadD
VFGDGVNIASRLQALAPAGGIWVSEAVYQNVANKTGVATTFVGEKALKNVKEPVRVYEVRPKNDEAESSELHLLQKNEPKAAPPKSIAVLPFVNMSNDPEQEYFSDGMAEELINSLNHLKDLKVAGRTSSFQFKGKNIDLRKVGEMLDVSTVLEGSVRKQNDRLRVTAQLIHVEDGYHIWSEKYDRTMDDIFAIQDEIALAITEQLKVVLFKKDLEKITKTYTHNAEAYELYLKARFYLYRRGSAILKGLEFSRKAIAVDPNFALAYACYADAQTLAAAYNFISGKEVKKEVKRAAKTAIKLDDSLGEAYFSLAYYYVCFEYKWEESKRNFYKAIELNPKFVQARSMFGMICLGWVDGNFDGAEEQLQTAIRLEPLSAIDHADLAWTLLMACKFDEALTIAKTGIELDNNSFLSHRIVGLCYIMLQRYEEAIATFQYLVNLSNRHQQAINGLIWAYCGNVNLKEAKKLMNELEMRAGSAHFDYGLSAAYLGDLDTAFDALEKAYHDLDPHILTIRHAPYIPVPLREDARFQDLLERIGFPK